MCHSQPPRITEKVARTLLPTAKKLLSEQAVDVSRQIENGWWHGDGVKVLEGQLPETAKRLRFLCKIYHVRIWRVSNFERHPWPITQTRFPFLQKNRQTFVWIGKCIRSCHKVFWSLLVIIYSSRHSYSSSFPSISRIQKLSSFFMICSPISSPVSKVRQSAMDAFVTLASHLRPGDCGDQARWWWKRNDKFKW